MSNALKEALYKKFVWKGEKRKEGKKFVQESEYLMDMSEERLNECYAHCKKMLNNSNPKCLGRYNVLKEVDDQINKCNVELYLRYCEKSYLYNENRGEIKRRSLWISLRKFMENINEARREEGKPELETEDWKTVSISKLADNVPVEFQDINVYDLLEGCIYCLGSFDKQHITMTFITKMGLWFTKAEELEFKAPNNLEKLKLAKEKLHLPNELILKLNDKGLSFHEMRAMLTLPKKQRYSDMTNEQLITLKNKVLFRLQKEIDSHIHSWKTLIKQIEKVANYKNYTLNDLN